MGSEVCKELGNDDDGEEDLIEGRRIEKKIWTKNLVDQDRTDLSFAIMMKKTFLRVTKLILREL